MAGVKPQRSPWALRLAIIGTLLLIIGSLVLSNQNDAIDSIYDPRERAIAEIVAGDSQLLDITDGGCYYVIVKAKVSGVDASMKPIEGSAASSDEFEPTSCLTDWTPMASDGTTFLIVEEWVVDKDGEAMLATTCSEEDCAGETVWIVSPDGWEMDLFDSTGILFGCGVCCIGFIVLPVAAVVRYWSRANTLQGSVTFIGPNQTISEPLQNQQEIIAALQQQHLQQNTNGEHLEREEQDGFVDGSKDVMQGRLLTTEQVFGLMRGEMDGEPQQKVQDPFADSIPKRHEPKAVVKKANTEAISVWDSGGGVANTPLENRPVREKTPRQDNSASKDWAEWDDM